ncbi:hypothetical protein LAY41_07990 [Argonema galeatum A003/A1]|nr:hypothetical protein [Argonema galeatum A003/A1]
MRSPEVEKPGFCIRYRLRGKGDLKNPVSFVGGGKGRSHFRMGEGVRSRSSRKQVKIRELDNRKVGITHPTLLLS